MALAAVGLPPGLRASLLEQGPFNCSARNTVPAFFLSDNNHCSARNNFRRFVKRQRLPAAQDLAYKRTDRATR